jgi:hypothetical protein
LEERMAHITEWPTDLNYPYQPSMFPEQDQEIEFWYHLLGCQTCRNELHNHTKESELLEDAFWKEVQEFLNGVHPSVERQIEKIIAEARLDLILVPSEEIKVEVFQRFQGVIRHLLICSKCSVLSTVLYVHLKERNRDVRRAFDLWQGPHPKGEPRRCPNR